MQAKDGKSGREESGALTVMNGEQQWKLTCRENWVSEIQLTYSLYSLQGINWLKLPLLA